LQIRGPKSANKQLFGFKTNGQLSTPRADARAINSKAYRAVDNFPKQNPAFTANSPNLSIQGRRHQVGEQWASHAPRSGCTQACPVGRCLVHGGRDIRI